MRALITRALRALIRAAPTLERAVRTFDRAAETIDRTGESIDRAAAAINCAPATLTRVARVVHRAACFVDRATRFDEQKSALAIFAARSGTPDAFTPPVRAPVGRRVGPFLSASPSRARPLPGRREKGGSYEPVSE